MQRLRSDSFPPITLPGGAGVAELRRCDDHFFRKARALSIPIELRNPRLISLADSRELGLPQLYAGLTALTGPSGDLYDDWKGAFSFPFKLTVRRGEREHRYLLNLMNYRSMVEPILYRVQQQGESYSRDTYHAPFEDELSSDDIVFVIDFIRGFVAGYLQTMPRWTVPFVKKVQSNFILFGYDPTSGEFFEQEYDEAEAYEAALERWHALIPEETTEKQMEELGW
jgi:hypothetical protein